jgi:hypothetical protein
MIKRDDDKTANPDETAAVQIPRDVDGEEPLPTKHRENLGLVVEATASPYFPPPVLPRRR